MKKNRQDTPDTAVAPKRRLRLSRETLRALGEDDLVAVAGGRSAGCYRGIPD